MADTTITPGPAAQTTTMATTQMTQHQAPGSAAATETTTMTTPSV